MLSNWNCLISNYSTYCLAITIFSGLAPHLSHTHTNRQIMLNSTFQHDAFSSNRMPAHIWRDSPRSLTAAWGGKLNKCFFLCSHYQGLVLSWSILNGHFRQWASTSKLMEGALHASSSSISISIPGPSGTARAPVGACAVWGCTVHGRSSPIYSGILVLQGRSDQPLHYRSASAETPVHMDKLHPCVVVL